eukprot:scaffold648_cov75-Skeletonema_dohrnii-CCMP3373.AAC.4
MITFYNFFVRASTIYDCTASFHRIVCYPPAACSTIRSTLSKYHPILHILACSGRRKAMSGDLESSHRALSIGGGLNE